MPAPHRSSNLTKNLAIGALFIFLCALSALIIWSPSSVARTGIIVGETTIVRCEPLVQEGVVDETLAIDIYIENVAGLYAADVRPSFDPGIAQAKDADGYPDNGVQMEALADFLSPDFIIKNDVDNATGTTWYAVTQLNPSPEASGSGSIVRLYLTGLRSGTFQITFDYAKIVRRDGSEIPSTWQACTVSYDETPTATPTPSSMHLPLILNGHPRPTATPTPLR